MGWAIRLGGNAPPFLLRDGNTESQLPSHAVTADSIAQYRNIIQGLIL